MPATDHIHLAEHYADRKAAEDALGAAGIPREIGDCDYTVLRHREGYVVRFTEPSTRRVLGYLA